MSSYEIDPEKRYNIPSKMEVVRHMDKILVVTPLTANWIVLDSIEQLKIFRSFAEGFSINEVLHNTENDPNDVVNVVTQIEARKLCTKQVHSSTDDVKNMHLYLTNKCNLFCPHCYMFSGKANDDELTTEEILSLLQNYKFVADGKRVTFSGGEPSLHVDFDLIVQHASEIGLEVKILTNGILFSPARIKKLARFISSIQISIDGYSEDSNSSIRGAGHFTKALEAVDNCVNNGIETSIAITPSFNLLEQHCEDYVLFAKTLLQKYRNANFQIKFAEGLSPGREVNPTTSFNEKYAHYIGYIQQKIYEENRDLVSFVEMMSSNAILDNCMFGSLSISSDGNVYLCPEVGILSPIANVRTDSFVDILKKSRDAEKASSIINLKPCKDCSLVYICGGGCRTKEFPKLTERTSFEDVNFKEIPPRHCSQQTKEKFYDMMIASNEYLFSPIDED